MLQKLKQFFSAEAFEQRDRDRERRKLVAELETLDETRIYIRGRTGALLSRMNVLNREDCAATLRGSSGQFLDIDGAEALARALARSAEPAAASFAAFGQALHDTGAAFERSASGRGLHIFYPMNAEAEFTRLKAWRTRILTAGASVLCLCAWLSW